MVSCEMLPVFRMIFHYKLGSNRPPNGDYYVANIISSDTMKKRCGAKKLSAKSPKGVNHYCTMACNSFMLVWTWGALLLAVLVV